MKWIIGLWMGVACGLAPARPVTVFEAGKEGYHTFRIPAVVMAKDGGLLAFCEARKNDRKDHGDIDLVLKRSDNKGKTWGALRILHDGGGDGPVTMGNPAPVVDATGKVHLVFCRNNSEVHYLSSDDHGATWSEPRDITQGLRKDGWGWYATGPGHGIQLSDGNRKGRIIIPANHRFGAQGDDKGAYGAHSIFSDDAGKSWQLGFIGAEANGIHPNENTAAELPAVDGQTRVFFNVRNNKGGNPHGRAGAISSDGGETLIGGFSAIETIDAPACQGSSLIADKGRMFFISPNGKKREKLTLRESSDEGKTWHAGMTIHEGPAAYSDIVKIGSEIIGVLYENGVKESYERISYQSPTVK